MLIFTKTQIQHLNVIANPLKQVGNGTQQPRNICRSRTSGIRQTNVPTLPGLSIR